MGDPEVDRQERDPDEEHGQQAGHDRERRRGVLRLGRLEGRDAGRDRLGARQGDGAGREGPHDEQDPDGSGIVAGLAAPRVWAKPEPSWKKTIRTDPMAIISSALPTNRYVGTAKMLPDSRRPRRLPSVMRAIATTPMITRSSSSSGIAEVICSTADDVDTATVIT